jgi:hypothetical protein
MVNSQIWVSVYFEVIVTPLPATHLYFIMFGQIVQVQYYWDSADELLSLPLHWTLIKCTDLSDVYVLAS